MRGRASAFVPILHAATADRPDEIDTIHSAEAVASALSRFGYETEIIGLDFDLSALDRLAARRPLVVFNLVEAMRGDGRLTPLVPAVLEHLRVPFTGGSSASLAATLSKNAMKTAMRGAGLPTPAWSMDGQGLPAGATVIVKADLEHGSLGMDAASVMPAAKATSAIRRRGMAFGAQFFAEEFIDGREFNVALVERKGRAELLPIAEITFEGFPEGRPRIVDYEAKWDEDSQAAIGTPRGFGVEAAEPALAAELTRLSLAAWKTFGVTGYARADFRVERTGRPYLLEMNVNPCVAPEAGFAAAARRAGLSFDELVCRLVDAPLDRGRIKRPMRVGTNAAHP